MSNNISYFYRDILNNWPSKAGPKPKLKYIHNVIKLGTSRLGSKDTIAVAMAMRPRGVTQLQILAALGSVHRAKLLELSKRGMVNLWRDRSGPFTVYKIQS